MHIMKYLYGFNMETCLFLAAQILEEEDGKTVSWRN